MPKRTLRADAKSVERVGEQVKTITEFPVINDAKPPAVLSFGVVSFYRFENPSNLVANLCEPF